jgi:predicted dehydrogenase
MSKSKKTFRVGVIGLGMGKGHVTGFQAHPQADVVAVCDLNEQLLNEQADALNVTGRYTDAKKMIRDEKLDIVSIATPNKFHKPLALAAFKHGAHVLCEKPMALNAREGKAMLDAARKANRRLMINFSFRFTAQAQALKRAVDDGVLGDVYFGRTVWLRRRGLPRFGGWFGQKALAGGGPLIDLGVHRLDLALWLMGYPQPTWVMGGAWQAIAGDLARKAKKTFDVEDLAAGMIKFENGAMLELEASWCANIAQRELMETRLLGTKAGLRHANIGEGYEFKGEIFLERNGDPYDMTLHEGPAMALQGAPGHLIDAILNDRPHIADGEQGLVVMKLLDALYKSAKEGKPVRIRND